MKCLGLRCLIILHLQECLLRLDELNASFTHTSKHMKHRRMGTESPTVRPTASPVSLGITY